MSIFVVEHQRIILTGVLPIRETCDSLLENVDGLYNTCNALSHLLGLCYLVYYFIWRKSSIIYADKGSHDFAGDNLKGLLKWKHQKFDRTAIENYSMEYPYWYNKTFYKPILN